MRPLRERREWRDAVENMEGGVSRKTLIDVRAEQKAPFRLFRLILVSGVGAGAFLGLIIITSRLFSALKGTPFHSLKTSRCLRLQDAMNKYEWQIFGEPAFLANSKSCFC